MKFEKNQNPTVIVAMIQLFCSVFFAGDILFEIVYSIKYIGTVNSHSYLHLILEFVVVIGLIAGFFVSRSFERKLNLDSQKSHQKAVCLTRAF